MYVVNVSLLLFAFPVVSVLAERFLLQSPLGVGLLIGKWFVFWAVGIRLFTAGLHQTRNPGFTAKGIFGIEGKDCWVVVQELGFANLALGLLGIWSVVRPEWTVPAALAGGAFYALAGIRHVMNQNKNVLEKVATYSDLLVAAILLSFFVSRLS